MTKTNKFYVSEGAKAIYSSLDKLGTDDLTFCNPIEFKLEFMRRDGDIADADPTHKPIALITNNVKECFGLIIPYGKGFVFMLPSFLEPIK